MAERPHTLRMKEHLLSAVNAGSQGGDGKLIVTQQLIDDLQETVVVLALIDIGKLPAPNRDHKG